MALRISERSLRVSKAKAKTQLLILDLAIEDGLTNIELLQMLIELQAGVLKDMRRAERHPDDPDRPADID